VARILSRRKPKNHVGEGARVLARIEAFPSIQLINLSAQQCLKEIYFLLLPHLSYFNGIAIGVKL
jgi:hypothetical protein